MNPKSVYWIEDTISGTGREVNDTFNVALLEAVADAVGLDGRAYSVWHGDKKIAQCRKGFPRWVAPEYR